MEGGVEVKEGSTIAGSLIRGPSHVGRGYTVKDSFVGPYTSIGDGVKLDGCEVGGSLILDGASLSHVRIVDSIIGANSKV